jgi:hypothetical protein
MGAGHSELGNRFEYLRACFWSFYEFIPNIVAGVTRKEVEYIHSHKHTYINTYAPAFFASSLQSVYAVLC